MNEIDRPQIIDQVLAEFRQRNGVPAVGALIVDADGEAISHVVGVRRRRSSDEVLPSDKWHIGSCTKSLTAALWARLFELGYAEWGTPLPEIFADLRVGDARWAGVTIRQVLQCRAGLPPNLRRGHFKASWEDTRPLPEQRSDVVERSLQRRPVGFHKFKYSNLSYIVAGAAIDRVAQTSFEDALQRYVLQPLGIASAGFGAPEAICGHRSRVTVRGMGAFRGPPRTPDDLKSDNPPVYSSAGCLHLSLTDWGALMRIFLSGNGTGLLHEDSLVTLFRNPASSGQCMGMGWMQPIPIMGVPYFMQGSNTLWSATAMVALDRSKCALIVCNDGRTRVLHRSVQLAGFLLAL